MHSTRGGGTYGRFINSTLMKIAILSHVIPPSPSGQSVILYRILSRISSSEYYLITSRYQQNGNDSFRLLSQVHTLDLEPSLRFGLHHIRNFVNLLISIFVRTRNLVEVFRLEPTRAVVACTGDLVDIPAAFFASRLTRIPFYAYIFDDFVYQWPGKYRIFAKLISPFIFRHSAGLIAPNEFICEEYFRRYGIEPLLVRNPCDAHQLDQPLFKDWPAESGKIKIIYSGAIYHANYDCFRNLLNAMRLLTEIQIELHIFTAQTSELLEIQGISGDKVFIHCHIPYADILAEQIRADILFLPLAFNSPIPEVIRTSAPGKLGEYLASGRPILAHVPADSFVANYCGRYCCAVLSNRNDPSHLAKKIKHVVEDKEYRILLNKNAVARALIDFSPEQASAAFLKVISFENN
jgi:glycosyltransferase involved in cell wall biosynthesis